MLVGCMVLSIAHPHHDIIAHHDIKGQSILIVVPKFATIKYANQRSLSRRKSKICRIRNHCYKFKSRFVGDSALSTRYAKAKGAAEVSARN